MHFSLTTTIPLLSALLTLATASPQPSTDANGCSVFEPTSAYQIYSTFPDLSTDLTIPDFGSNQTNGTAATNGTQPSTTRRRSSSAISRHDSRTRRSAHIPFTFYVSQDADGANAQDLVVAFAHLPCYGAGPFSFEFNFVPQSAYFAEGQGQINMFRVDTQDLGDGPTWNSVEPVTGSLVGTFELPTVGSEEPVLLFLNQLVCQEELVLRFGITRYSSEEGSVAYMNAGGMGLRERNGC